jgi:hypothetical protein
MKKILPILMAVVFSLNACKPATIEPVIKTPAASNETVTPHVIQIDKPIPIPTFSDTNPVRGNVYFDSAELLISESSPVQFTLMLKGNLPTPCDQLQVKASQPDAKNKISVDLYSTTQADKICSQLLEPFEKNFPLGSFPTGHYSLWVNGQKIAEFDA